MRVTNQHKAKSPYQTMRRIFKGVAVLTGVLAGIYKTSSILSNSAPTVTIENSALSINTIPPFASPNSSIRPATTVTQQNTATTLDDVRQAIKKGNFKKADRLLAQLHSTPKTSGEIYYLTLYIKTALKINPNGRSSQQIREQIKSTIPSFIRQDMANINHTNHTYKNEFMRQYYELFRYAAPELDIPILWTALAYKQNLGIGCTQNLSQATESFSRADQHNYLSPLDLYTYGNLLNLTGRPKEAISVLKRANSIQVLLTLGNLYFAEGSLYEAIDCFQTVLTRSPTPEPRNSAHSQLKVTEDALYNSIGDMVTIVTAKARELEKQAKTQASPSPTPHQKTQSNLSHQ